MSNKVIDIIKFIPYGHENGITGRELQNITHLNNRRVREIYVSHLHTEIESKDINGCKVRRLPTGVIKGKFDRKHAYTMNNERFIISEFDHKHLKSIHYIDRV